MVGMLDLNHTNAVSFVSQTATMTGRTSKSFKWIQRAAALANSRPINPRPIIPNRRSLVITLVFLDVGQSGINICSFVHDDTRESPGHRSRPFMLDDVSTVDNIFPIQSWLDKHEGRRFDLRRKVRPPETESL